MIAIILVLAAGLAFCTLLYACAVHALPVVVGLHVALWAMRAGAGEIGGLALGLAAGALLFALVRWMVRTSRSAVGRWSVALAFAIPAAWAGTGLVQQLWPLVLPTTPWQHAVSLVVAAATGATALARLGDPPFNVLRLGREGYRPWHQRQRPQGETGHRRAGAETPPDVRNSHLPRPEVGLSPLHGRVSLNKVASSGTCAGRR